MAKIPPLRPLCLILKVFLQQRELNEVWGFIMPSFCKECVLILPMTPMHFVIRSFVLKVYSGGIGSYALLTMLIAHLQVGRPCCGNLKNGSGLCLYERINNGSCLGLYEHIPSTLQYTRLT